MDEKVITHQKLIEIREDIKNITSLEDAIKCSKEFENYINNMYKIFRKNGFYRKNRFYRSLKFRELLKMLCNFYMSFTISLHTKMRDFEKSKYNAKMHLIVLYLACDYLTDIIIENQNLDNKVMKFENKNG